MFSLTRNYEISVKLEREDRQGRCEEAYNQKKLWQHRLQTAVRVFDVSL